MANSWDIEPLREVADVIDSRHKTPQYLDQGIAMVRVVDVKGGPLDFGETRRVSDDDYLDYSKGRDPQVGDMVISRVGSYGNISYVKDASERFCLGQNTALIVPKINWRYLYYQLLSPSAKAQIEQSVVGAVQKTISLRNIKALEIPVPPHAEQERLAHILGTLDDKIELNRRMNGTLEAMAQTIFKSWFVDFEPVKAKVAAKAAGATPAAIERAAMAAIAGRSIEEAIAQESYFDDLTPSNRESLAQTAALFPDAFQTSDIGEIPVGWRSAKLSDIVDLTMGQSPKSEFYNESGTGLPFHQGVTNYGARFPIHRTYCTIESRIANAGDLLFSVRAPVGRINIADQKLVIGRGLAAMRYKSNLQTFLTYLLQYNFQKEDSIGSGTIFNSVTKKELRDFSCVKPDEKLAEAFDTAITPMDRQIAVNGRQSRTLAQLRDTLLPKLLSGELTVPEAESRTEDALT